MENILDTIIKDKYIEVELLKTSLKNDLDYTAEKNLECSLTNNPYTGIKRSFIDHLKKSNTMQVIAEIKRGSPSKGLFAPDLDVSAQATQYEASGASAISVLTDKTYFYGHTDDLKLVRRTVDLPILCKDFIVDELQITQAHSIGADMILLIVAVHSKDRLQALLNYAQQLDLQVLMEVHDKDELDIALSLNHDLIGINNRNLKTFETSIETSIELIKHVKDPSIMMISESGIKTVEDVQRLSKAGFKGILVGESLIRDGVKGSLMASISQVRRGVK